MPADSWLCKLNVYKTNKPKNQTKVLQHKIASKTFWPTINFAKQKIDHADSAALASAKKWQHIGRWLKCGDTWQLTLHMFGWCHNVKSSNQTHSSWEQICFSQAAKVKLKVGEWRAMVPASRFPLPTDPPAAVQRSRIPAAAWTTAWPPCELSPTGHGDICVLAFITPQARGPLINYGAGGWARRSRTHCDLITRPVRTISLTIN